MSEPCPECGCPGAQYGGHVCEDFAANRDGPGCPRHLGDPHGGCPECWKLEPDSVDAEVERLHAEPA